MKKIRAKLDKKKDYNHRKQEQHTHFLKGKKTKTQRFAVINEKPLGFLSTEDVFNW